MRRHHRCKGVLEGVAVAVDLVERGDHGSIHQIVHDDLHVLAVALQELTHLDVALRVGWLSVVRG